MKKLKLVDESGKLVANVEVPDDTVVMPRATIIHGSDVYEVVAQYIYTHPDFRVEYEVIP